MPYMVVGVSGRRGAGKDTAFGYIQEWCAERGVSAGRRGFADSLKHSFARMFIPDISVDEAVIWCDEIKFTGTLEIFWSNAEAAIVNGWGTTTEIKHSISGRVALQRFGTEGHREVFGDDFWVDALLPIETFIDDLDGEIPIYPRNFMGQMDQRPPQVSVCTDVRFDNEGARVKTLHGVNLVITRPDDTSRDEHISEAGIMGELVDCVILNDGDLDELRAKVRIFCEEFLSPRLADG